MTLTRQVIRQANDRAQVVSQHVLFQAQNALSDAAKAGKAPNSNSPEDLLAYVQKSLEDSAALTSSIAAEVGYSPSDLRSLNFPRHGNVLISSDDSLIGKQPPTRTDLSELVSSSFSGQIRVIYGPPRAYEVDYPFELGAPGRPSAIWHDSRGRADRTVAPRHHTAVAFGGIAGTGIGRDFCFACRGRQQRVIAPLKRITAQLDRISKGEFDQKPLERGDEFGQVSTKISQIGMQLRGVREIFSTLRENLDQVLGGLDDGLLCSRSTAVPSWSVPPSNDFFPSR